MSKFIVIAVDVGTESVRSCLVQYDKNTSNNSLGKILITKTQKITIHKPNINFVEQNSKEIWESVKTTIIQCSEELNINTELIKAIAFTGTCSLGLVDSKLPTGNDVIMWMDHRATDIANDVTNENEEILNQFGGSLSPEFSISKIFWLKKEIPEVYFKVKLFLELPCLLTFMCVKDNLVNYLSFKQSVCSTVCKYGFNSEINQWPLEFYKKWGFTDIGNKICEKNLNPGSFVDFVHENILNEFKIKSKDVSVATSIIDAHAGVYGMLALYRNYELKKNKTRIEFDNVLAMVAGSSTCAMVLNRQKTFTNKVWGPYYNVIFEDHFVREAGQSATGTLIEFIVKTHPDRNSKYKNLSIKEIIQKLNDFLFEKRMNLLKDKNNLNKKLEQKLKNSLIINPDFYGNRSPIAEAQLKGTIYGFSMNEISLIDLYESVLEGLAFEVKYIIEELNLNQEELKIIVSGGLTKNKMYMQIHSDILNCQITTMNTQKADMMLVGTSILAHQAYFKNNSKIENLENIFFDEIIFENYLPEAQFINYNKRKYKCYRKLTDCSLEICKIMKNKLL